MEVDNKTNVAFGTTLDREMYPIQMPPNRFGNELIPLKGAPHRGPGCYENEEVSNFKWEIDHFVTTNKGYTLGARTGPRFRKEFQEITPSPDTYQTKCTKPLVFDPAYKPFNAADKRFPVFKRDLEQVLPGAGTYEHDTERNRKVTWHQSFGGAPINLPSVETKSTINKNTEKLISTKESKKYSRKLAYLKLYYD
ncbi:unnamed protein product [Owenia fusiformis]|uniref:Uncharacterized protein n=1 Tax=Owenia fusiformis TaxID=6347 RepID=A0A8J1U4G0_OWEFU|nr:unnamed protein product [Owenia fusiformis]